MSPGSSSRRDFTFLDSWSPFPERGSGTAVAIAGLAAALRRRGHAVRRLHPPGGGSSALLPRLAFNLGLRGRLREGSPGTLVGFDLDGCFLPHGRLRPYVVCLKGILAEELRFERGATRRKLRCLSRLERRNARAADLVCVTSRYSRRAAIRAYGLEPERVRVVPEGIELESWSGPGGAPAGPGRDPSRPVILSVARQYPRKNTETLLRALPEVLERVPGARLRVVGGGPRLPRLQELVTELRLGAVVELVGELPETEDVRAEYRAADVFCLPSRQEGFGLVFLEAMASGLPVVAGRAGAVPEVVPDGVAGLLVPPLDGGALAGALGRLLTDGELRRRLGAEGRERAKAYDWDRVAQRFLDAVREPPRPAAGGAVPEGGPS